MTAGGSVWRFALLRAVVAVALLAVVGLALGRLLPVLLLGAAAAIAWHLFNLLRLLQWLRQKPKPDPPLTHGLWGEAFNGLHRLQRRHRKRHHHLLQLLKKMRETLDTMPDAAVILHGDGETRWWNRAARELLGLGGATDQGQRITKLFRNPRFTAFLYHAPENSPEPLIVPSPIDESLMLEVRIIPYGDEQYLLLARDVTRLQRLERTRRDFVANVSHELRTPLTSIYGLAELLVAHPAAEHPDLRRPLELIEQQAQRMQRLVEDLLTLSRLETDQRRAAAPVDVSRMLAALVEEARAVSAERHHDIRLQAEQGLCIRGEESDLRSACANLIFNAVQYTPAGGQITVDWRSAEDGWAELSVQDTGIGIAAEHVPRLTERFYRVDKARSVNSGGTGLGLAIVKHVLERHDAQLDIHSELGAGTRFLCRFPPKLVVQRQGTSLARSS